MNQTRRPRETPQRISVTGNSGSGKSTFAVRLGALLGLPVIHLDELQWWPDGTPRSPEDFEKHLRDALSGQRWIVEGFNIESFHVRAEAADALIILDISPLVAASRLLFKRGRRVGVHESVGRHSWRQHLRFLKWVLIYRSDRRPGTMRDASRYATTKPVVALTSTAAVGRFLRNIKDGSAWESL